MLDLRDCRAYMAACLKIKDKKGNIVPLKLNKAQERLYQQIRELEEMGLPVRILVLKARQMGFSTVIEGINFWDAATSFRCQCMVVAHQEESTNALFAMTKRFYENLPDPVKPMRKASNGRELEFAAPSNAPRGTLGLDSAIRVATAGGRGIGRGFTLRRLHLSEFAFWPGDKLDTLLGLMQTLPNEAGTAAFIESTANGFDQFKDMWDEAEAAWARGERDGWCPFFAAWHEMEEYRREPGPDFVRTEEEEQLAEAYHLDDSQLAWRRWCIKINCGGDERLFRQEYPSSPQEAFVASGDCWFNQEAVLVWLVLRQQAESSRGRFLYDYDGLTLTNIRWQEDSQGEIALFNEPVPGTPYVLGGDTAGDSGGAWSDWFTGQVLDNVTGRQVARLRAKLDEDEYARQMYCLGMHYNTALIGVEVNFSTHPVKELARLRYPKLYVREVPDTYTGKLRQSFGWMTSPATRSPILAVLKETARDALHLIQDPDTLEEMLSFARNERGRPEALPGKHDDLVLGLAIAYAIRGQQSQVAAQPEEEKVTWTASQWEDYQAASPEERAYLRKKWGEPR
ncbi:MAG: hypothetical protein IKK50_03755 [Ruminiclostridium sp.]|nr:hypothetical protein [Ruminiclostridium sp.]